MGYHILILNVIKKKGYKFRNLYKINTKIKIISGDNEMIHTSFKRCKIFNVKM